MSMLDEYDVTEYDGYRLPPPFTGEFTPEVLAAKDAADRKAEEIMRRLKAELASDNEN